MDFQTAVRACLQKYVTFSGRAARPEFWYFVLFAILANVAASIVDRALFGGSGGSGPVGGLIGLALFLPNLAVGVRRLHDTDRSGWWLLIGFIPLAGAIVLLIWFVRRGTAGSNRFGADPQEASGALSPSV